MNLFKIKINYIIPVKIEDFYSSVLKFAFLLLHRSLILSNLSEFDNKTFMYRGRKKNKLPKLQ